MIWFIGICWALVAVNLALAAYWEHRASKAWAEIDRIRGDL